MIPQGASLPDDQEIEYTQETSRTYKIDFTNKRISGMIDGLEAVKQAVYHILKTERFQFLIYSADYGVELAGLIGAEPAFVRSELKRRITEALLQDDRIDHLEGFQIDVNGESAVIRFTVVSQFGHFEMIREVTRNV